MQQPNAVLDAERLIHTDKPTQSQTHRVYHELSFDGLVTAGSCSIIILCLAAVVISEAKDGSVHAAAVFNLLTAITTILITFAVFLKTKSRAEWKSANVILAILLWISWFISLVVLTHTLRITSHPFGGPKDEKKRRGLGSLTGGGSRTNKVLDPAMKTYAGLAGPAWACVGFDVVQLLYFSIYTPLIVWG